MKDNTKPNITNHTGNGKPDGKLDEPLAAYTPRQRKTIIKGLGILARVAIRSYLRRHGEEFQSEIEPVREDEN